MCKGIAEEGGAGERGKNPSEKRHKAIQEMQEGLIATRGVCVMFEATNILK